MKKQQGVLVSIPNSLDISVKNCVIAFRDGEFLLPPIMSKFYRTSKGLISLNLVDTQFFTFNFNKGKVSLCKVQVIQSLIQDNQQTTYLRTVTPRELKQYTSNLEIEHLIEQYLQDILNS